MQVDSAVQHELPQKVAIRAKKTRISKIFGWISETLSHFGYPDENVTEKAVITTGAVRWRGKFPLDMST